MIAVSLDRQERDIQSPVFEQADCLSSLAADTFKELSKVIDHMMLIHYKLKVAIKLQISTVSPENQLGGLPAAFRNLPPIIQTNLTFGKASSSLKVIIHDDYYSIDQTHDSDSQTFAVARQLLKTIGTLAVKSQYSCEDFDQLQQIFTIEELSFAGILAIGDPTIGNSSTSLVRRLFRVLKREQNDLDKWKAFCGLDLTSQVTVAPRAIEVGNPLAKFFNDDMTPTAAQTAEGSNKNNDKNGSGRHRLLRELQEYKSCDSMPALKLEDMPLGNFENGPSIKSRVESMMPVLKEFKSLSPSKFGTRRGSVRTAKIYLMKKEEELENALEDSMESDDNESEMEELVSDLKWHYTEALEDLLRSKEYLAHDYGHQQKVSIENLHGKLDSKLLDYLSLVLLKREFNFVDQEDFKSLIKQGGNQRDQPKLSDYNCLKLYAESSIRMIAQLDYLHSSSTADFKQRVSLDTNLLLDYCQLFVVYCQEKNLSLFLQATSVLLG